MPHSNRAYWNAKIKRNKTRDKEVSDWYYKNGWRLMRFWEHDLSGKGFDRCVMAIIKEAKRIYERVGRSTIKMGSSA